MSKSYSQLMREMDVLKAKAESVRKKELQGVVERIKEAVSFYELTAADLGLANGVAVAKRGPARAAKKATSKAAGAAKFGDDQGNTWSGRGPRPGWFKKALAAGKTAADFAVAGAAATPAAAKKKGPGRKRAARAKPAPKYKDASGKTWSGRGRKPGWFTQAIAAGQTPQSMMI